MVLQLLSFWIPPCCILIHTTRASSYDRLLRVFKAVQAAFHHQCFMVYWCSTSITHFYTSMETSNDCVCCSKSLCNHSVHHRTKDMYVNYLWGLSQAVSLEVHLGEKALLKWCVGNEMQHKDNGVEVHSVFYQIIHIHSLMVSLTSGVKM